MWNLCGGEGVRSNALIHRSSLWDVGLRIVEGAEEDLKHRVWGERVEGYGGPRGGGHFLMREAPLCFMRRWGALLRGFFEVDSRVWGSPLTRAPRAGSEFRGRSRADMAHVSEPRPNSGLGF